MGCHDARYGNNSEILYASVTKQMTNRGSSNSMTVERYQYNLELADHTEYCPSDAKSERIAGSHNQSQVLLRRLIFSTVLLQPIKPYIQNLSSFPCSVDHLTLNTWQTTVLLISKAFPVKYVASKSQMIRCLPLESAH